MRNVRGGRIQVLVATDIASRGIDISHLTHVINYSLPEDPAVYLHRSGRTGRIGKKGHLHFIGRCTGDEHPSDLRDHSQNQL